MKAAKLIPVAFALALLAGCTTPTKPAAANGNKAGPVLIPKFVYGHAGGAQKCSAYLESRTKSQAPGPYANLYSDGAMRTLAWAQGFQSGWNFRSLSDEDTDTALAFNIGGEAFADLDRECGAKPDGTVFDAMLRIVHSRPTAAR